MVKRLCMRATLFKRTAQRVLHLGASLSQARNPCTETTHICGHQTPFPFGLRDVASKTTLICYIMNACSLAQTLVYNDGKTCTSSHVHATLGNMYLAQTSYYSASRNDVLSDI